eukprot:NODE_3212_length_802_cov_3.006640_g2680_i0.p5 GENE.NODE_3212_length_802_cov_3.006640_g2680_i0~~NODE_3212_length_802_cov_3.006640_g2680_i0.p5  ORF type:complete len:56 (-),score=6.53 NODE_3212_length_802_cov_3.006640_g2680_i0:9-176(-)
MHIPSSIFQQFSVCVKAVSTWMQCSSRLIATLAAWSPTIAGIAGIDACVGNLVLR